MWLGIKADQWGVSVSLAFALLALGAVGQGAGSTVITVLTAAGGVFLILGLYAMSRANKQATQDEMEERGMRAGVRSRLRFALAAVERARGPARQSIAGPRNQHLLQQARSEAQEAVRLVSDATLGTEWENDVGIPGEHEAAIANETGTEIDARLDHVAEAVRGLLAGLMR